jgi:hypothetical protein
MDSVAKSALDASVAGSPYGWETFPSIEGNRGTRFLWYLDEQDGRGHSYVALRAVGSPAYRLVLGAHCRPFTIERGWLGLWFPEPQSIRVVCFDLETLPEIPRPARFGRLQMRFHAGLEPIDSLFVPHDLLSGSHVIAFPRSLQPINELLAVGLYGAAGTTTILSLRPWISEVTIYPQQWFDDMFRGGWECISRVTRHPERGTIIGDGSRIRPFELTEDGCHLAQWL